MAAIYSNGGNRWNILGFNFTKRDALSSVYKISMLSMDGSAGKSVERTKPTDGGMENNVRGHRQRRSENQQMERVLTRRQLFSSGFCLTEVPIAMMLEETDTRWDNQEKET
jgi:hypothetical protein